MNKYIASALGICTLAVVLLVSCNKINQATDMGQDLIPPVDNIHTFDTTLEVETYNNIFTFAQDSGTSIYSDIQILGNINNDPIFGKTEAKMYLQLLTNTNFSSVPGKRTIDSVVLVLNPYQIYGDTAQSQNIEVFEMAQGTEFNPVKVNYVATPTGNVPVPERRTGYPYSYSNFTTAGLLGSAQVIPYKLKDSITLIRKDTSKVPGQLRVRLANSFGQRLLSYDSATVVNDTLFKQKVKGFAIQSTSGNGLMAFSGSTSMIVYYRAESATTAGSIDTTQTTFNVFAESSATANYIQRNYFGTQIETTSGDQIFDQEVYLQNTPGTFATVKIPGLKGFTNGVIHLAELQMESVYDNQDTLFYSPPLFLDMYDSSAAKYKIIPYSLNYTSGGALDLASFGSYASRKLDAGGKSIKYWRFNLTRFVQKVVGDLQSPNSFRLYSTANMVLPDDNKDNQVGRSSEAVVQPFGSVVPGIGRVRLGGGNHPTQKMKLRIVYSKI